MYGNSVDPSTFICEWKTMNFFIRLIIQRKNTASQAANAQSLEQANAVLTIPGSSLGYILLSLVIFQENVRVLNGSEKKESDDCDITITCPSVAAILEVKMRHLKNKSNL